MELRPALMPPVLDESVVARLTSLAEEIDCGHAEQTREQVAVFNQEASTELEFIDFQGIYGGQDHDTLALLATFSSERATPGKASTSVSWTGCMSMASSAARWAGPSRSG
jgi:hypothetical protein